MHRAEMKGDGNEDKCERDEDEQTNMTRRGTLSELGVVSVLPTGQSLLVYKNRVNERLRLFPKAYGYRDDRPNREGPLPLCTVLLLYVGSFSFIFAPLLLYWMFFRLLGPLLYVNSPTSCIINFYLYSTSMSGWHSSRASIAGRVLSQLEFYIEFHFRFQ